MKSRVLQSGGRQQWMVVVFCVLLVYLVWTRLIAPNIGGGVGFASSEGGRQVEVADLVELRADLLEPQTGVYKRGRNVFTYRQPRQRRQKPKPKPKPAEVEPKPEPAAAQEPPAPKPPNFGMRFLGSFGPAERPIAVFVDGEDLYNLRVGDVVKEEFVLVAVGFESADIGYVNFPQVEPRRVGLAGS